MKRSAGSPLSRTICHCAVRPPGRRSSGLSSIRSANSFLLFLLARWYSSRHHVEASHSSETINKTASQRVAASAKACCHLWPAAMPRSGSRSRKMSSGRLQPSVTSQSRKAMAQSSLRLEWLMKTRDNMPPVAECSSPKFYRASDAFQRLSLVTGDSAPSFEFWRRSAVQTGPYHDTGTSNFNHPYSMVSQGAGG